MSSKYEIYREIGWDNASQSPTYERLTVVKNERYAVDFVNNLNNIAKYGDMLIKVKSNGNLYSYKDVIKS